MADEIQAISGVSGKKDASPVGGASASSSAHAAAPSSKINTTDVTQISSEALEDLHAVGGTQPSNLASSLTNSQGPQPGMAVGGVVTSSGGYHGDSHGFSSGGVFNTSRPDW